MSNPSNSHSESVRFFLKNLIKNYQERRLTDLKGRSWICRLEYYDHQCSGAANCCDCLSLEANFDAYVLIV